MRPGTLDRLAIAVVSATTAIVVTNAHWEKAMAKNVKAAQTQGAASCEVDYKKIALSDPKLTRGVCTAWWFGSNGKERKL